MPQAAFLGGGGTGWAVAGWEQRAGGGRLKDAVLRVTLDLLLRLTTWTQGNPENN